MFRRANRTFSLVAAVTLALGIGSNAAVFSVLNAAVLRPLPYPDAERIVRLKGGNPQAFFSFGPHGPVVYPHALTESPAFTAIGMVAAGGVNLGGAPAERLTAACVSPAFFSVLGVRPAAGRFLATRDAEDGLLAVISDALWRRRFGSDPAMIGRSIVLNGRAYTVIGIAPRQAMYPEGTDVWIPGGADDQLLGVVPTPQVLARLAPGVTPAQARPRVAAAYFAPQPVTPARLDTITVQPLKEELTGGARPIALLVALAAALILMVSCINVANLLLARVAARHRELAIRRALGATPGRIVRGLLAESLTLAMVAGLAAIPAAFWTLPLLRQLLPAGLHGADAIAIDRQVIVVTAGLSLLTTILFGLAPAISLWRVPLANPLRGSSTTTASRSWRLFRSGLVVVEAAIALLLLAGAAAIVANVSRLAAADIGARRAGALTFGVTLPATRYDSNEKIVAFVDRLVTETHGIAGVEAVGAVNELPGNAAESLIARRISIAGLPEPSSSDARYALALSASPEYFSALGIPLLAGRTFTPDDRPGASPVAIVSQGYARALALTPGAIIGKRILLEPARGRVPEQWGDVVGVVGDVKLRGPEGKFATASYVPFAVSPPRFAPVRLVVAAGGDPESMPGLVRAAVARVDPDVPLFAVKTFGDVQAEYLAGRRFAMKLVLAFGVLAVILTGTGLFGVIAYLVQLRTREIGIRMAIGATRGRIRRGVLVHGLGHAAIGAVLGLALFAAAARVVAAKAPNVGTIDAKGCALAVAFVIAVALAAAWIPACRATEVDPIVALRVE